KITAPAGDGDVPQVFTGHGLSTNVVEASLRAYLAAVNKLIAEHPVAADAVQAARERRSAASQAPTPAGSAS
ncbi:MAG: alpha-isopropylmalate synthase regulatory domain-containing protein, partial [Candidatus Limnocylindria bacterium]